MNEKLLESLSTAELIDVWAKELTRTCGRTVTKVTKKGSVFAAETQSASGGDVGGSSWRRGELLVAIPRLRARANFVPSA
jgi:hypothetical protein